MASGPRFETLNYPFQMLLCDMKHISSWSGGDVLGMLAFINNRLA